jgi:hypothetical protein
MLESSSTVASPTASPMTCLTRTTSKRKEVRFCSSVLVRCTLHLHNYSDEEIKACWNDASEMASIRTNALATVAMMERTTIHADETKCCTRGLEQKTREGSDLRRYNRMKAQYAVLHAQERQKRDGIVDEYKIASTYSERVEMCQIQAHMLAVSAALELQLLDRSSSSSNLKRSSSVPNMCGRRKNGGRRLLLA